MSKKPWFKMYPDDFVSGTFGLTLEQKGAYITVLSVLYSNQDRLPDTDQNNKTIAHALGVTMRKWNRLRSELIEMNKLKVVNGAYTNDRFERELEKFGQSFEQVLEVFDESFDERLPKDCQNLEKNPIKTRADDPLYQKPDTRDHIPEYNPPIDPPLGDTNEERLAIERYNNLAGQKNLPRVKDFTATRKQKLNKRLRKVGLGGWYEACDRVRESPFLCGQNDRNWRASFDFLLQESSFTKIMEGTYGEAKPQVNWDKIMESWENDPGGNSPDAGENANALPDPPTRREQGRLPSGVRQVAEVLSFPGSDESG